MGKHILVAMTNPNDGRDDDFNDWYSNTHVHEVVAIPGFVSAQRFKLSPEQAGDGSEFEYLAIYEIEAENAGAALQALKEARPNLNMSDALADERAVFAYDQITEKITA